MVLKRDGKKTILKAKPKQNRIEKRIDVKGDCVEPQTLSLG
jgi:hypothetical protein